MSRLYAVEALFTLTGANADHRLRVAASAVPAVAARLAGGDSRAGGHGWRRWPTLCRHWPVRSGGNEKWIVECAKDLLANQGKCLVMAGHRQPLAVHLLADAINAALGNVGNTVILHGSAGDQGRFNRRTWRRRCNGGQWTRWSFWAAIRLTMRRRFELGGGAGQGKDGRAPGLLRGRIVSAKRLETCRSRIFSNRGAMPAPRTARWFRSSR